ncbi:uncharacterized protein DS421_10g296250 [Arachis hypogaea]|nr:uncharacterized protein DS421_10g296250 [Arachis hypogaea]
MKGEERNEKRRGEEEGRHRRVSLPPRRCVAVKGEEAANHSHRTEERAHAQGRKSRHCHRVLLPSPPLNLPSSPWKPKKEFAKSERDTNWRLMHVRGSGSIRVTVVVLCCRVLPPLLLGRRHYKEQNARERGQQALPELRHCQVVTVTVGHVAKFLLRGSTAGKFGPQSSLEVVAGAVAARLPHFCLAVGLSFRNCMIKIKANAVSSCFVSRGEFNTIEYENENEIECEIENEIDDEIDYDYEMILNMILIVIYLPGCSGIVPLAPDAVGRLHFFRLRSEILFTLRRTVQWLATKTCRVGFVTDR